MKPLVLMRRGAALMEVLVLISKVKKTCLSEAKAGLRFDKWDLLNAR